MAFSALIRKATPSAALLVTRSSLTTLNHSISRSFSSVENARDLADANLYQILKRRIKFAESKLENLQVNTPLDSFPFKIEDEPSCPSKLELCSKFHDEDVIISIKWSDVNTKELESKTPSIPMAIRYGKDPVMRFHIIASLGEIAIQRFSVCPKEYDYETINCLEFKDLNDDLQQSLYKFLKIRGIKSDIVSFVIQTLIMKTKENNIMVMKHFKDAIRN